MADRRAAAEQRTVASDDVRKRVLVVAIVCCNCHAMVLRAAILLAFALCEVVDYYFTRQRERGNEESTDGCCLSVARIRAIYT